uniref:Uncharacterized protein n=1 Tax=Arundo donax TaxID=35708 RepID=A0A0A9AM54_ARUDO
MYLYLSLFDLHFRFIHGNSVYDSTNAVKVVMCCSL